MRRSLGGWACGRFPASRFCSVAVVAIFLSAVWVPLTVNAAGVDLTGVWDLTVTLNQVEHTPAGSETPPACRWRGLMTLLQTGSDFTGSIDLSRVLGTDCPDMLSGMVQGSVSGSGSGFFINFGLASGQFGQVSFEGLVSEDMQSAMGSWSNQENGTWLAVRHRVAAPALSTLSFAALFALMTVAGIVCVRRRQS